MVVWHQRHDGHEFEEAPGVGDGQGSLACCSPWGCKEWDTTEQLNWTEAAFTGFSSNPAKIVSHYFYRAQRTVAGSFPFSRWGPGALWHWWAIGLTVPTTFESWHTSSLTYNTTPLFSIQCPPFLRLTAIKSYIWGNSPIWIWVLAQSHTHTQALWPLHCAVLSCFSHVWVCVTLWTVACQASQSMGFYRQEYFVTFSR